MKAWLTTLLLACTCNIVQAVEVTANGYGASYDEALQNAKIAATESAASTFITGKRELNNGVYSETVGQYNGGIVQHVTVVSTEVKSGLYKVVIKADVRMDKVNRVIIPNTVDTSPRVTDAVNDMNKTLDAWDAINKASHPFSILTDDVTFHIQDQSTVKVVYRFHAMWNPKWIDDVKQLVKVAGHSVDEKTRAVVCINSVGYESPFSCDGISAIPRDNYLPGNIQYAVVLHLRNGASVQYAKASMGVYSNHTHDQSTYRFVPYRTLPSGWFTPRIEVEAMDINKDITVREVGEFTVSPTVADSITGITIEAN